MNNFKAYHLIAAFILHTIVALYITHPLILHLGSKKIMVNNHKIKSGEEVLQILDADKSLQFVRSFEDDYVYKLNN